MNRQNIVRIIFGISPLIRNQKWLRRAVDIGCGCGGAKSTRNVTTLTTKETVYQVLKNNEITGEFTTIQDARLAAIANGGRVKVTSK